MQHTKKSTQKAWAIVNVWTGEIIGMPNLDIYQDKRIAEAHALYWNSFTVETDYRVVPVTISLPIKKKK